jgi:rubrerythrin
VLTGIAFALALGLAFFVAAPLLAADREGGTLPVDVTPLADLKRRRLVVYENLQDLEFEYHARKIAPQDYEALRQTYTAEAAGLMATTREIERGGAEHAFIEREVAKRRAQRQAPPPPEYVCPQCGFENPVPVKFCGECGAKMRTQ